MSFTKGAKYMKSTKEVRGNGENSHYFKVGDKLFCTKGNKYFTEGEVYPVKYVYDDRFNGCKLETDDNWWLVTKEHHAIVADFGTPSNSAYFELVTLLEDDDTKDTLLINNQKVRLLGVPNGLEIYETLENKDKVMYINQNGKLLLKINISCDKNSEEVDVHFS